MCCGEYCVGCYILWFWLLRVFVIWFNIDLYASKHFACPLKPVNKSNDEILSITGVMVVDIQDETQEYWLANFWQSVITEFVFHRYINNNDIYTTQNFTVWFILVIFWVENAQSFQVWTSKITFVTYMGLWISSWFGVVITFNDSFCWYCCCHSWCWYKLKGMSSLCRVLGRFLWFLMQCSVRFEWCW